MKTQRAVSFDESSMESCSAPAQEELLLLLPSPPSRAQGPNGCETSTTGPTGVAREAQEITSLEEAKTVIAALRAKQRAQTHQMLAWRRTLKLQEELVARLTREKAEQLRSLSSQLLLFESRLCRKQKEIEASLAQREAIILRQQKVIKQLQNKLRHVSEASKAVTGSGSLGTPTGRLDTRESPPCDALDRLDSLGDSDSAVVLEEAFLDDPTPPRFRSNLTDVTVIRSVSDAVEPANKYCAASRRCNGFLRRPEVLETVYSVEEDGDADRPEEADEEDNNEAAGGDKSGASNSHQQQQQQQQSSSRSSSDKPRLRDLYGSFERLHETEGREGQERAAGCATTTGKGAQRSGRDESQQAQVTYNRVMSNHRSVTKPKDVKYKRINKAKSKSLEELRGRLRNWVEKGNKIAISLDQSYA